MSARTIAKRYAAALFDVTHKAGTDERAGRDLVATASLIADHDDLRRVVETPTIPPQIKKAVLTAVLSAAGDVNPEVERMLGLLADRDRLALVPEVARAFSERLMQAQRIVPAEVVTAVPLSDGARTALTQRARQGGRRAGDADRANRSGDYRRRGGQGRQRRVRRQHHAPARADGTAVADGRVGHAASSPGRAT